MYDAHFVVQLDDGKEVTFSENDRAKAEIFALLTNLPLLFRSPIMRRVETPDRWLRRPDRAKGKSSHLKGMSSRLCRPFYQFVRWESHRIF